MSFNDFVGHVSQLFVGHMSFKGKGWGQDSSRDVLYRELVGIATQAVCCHKSSSKSILLDGSRVGKMGKQGEEVPVAGI